MTNRMKRRVIELHVPTLQTNVRLRLRDRSAAPGTVPLVIDDLVSPLRYDIIVRADFFTFLSEHIDLLETDPDELVARASTVPYSAWFQRVAISRYHRPARRNQDL